MPVTVTDLLTGHDVQPSRLSALAGGESNVPYDAADYSGQHLGAWQPFLTSADSELNIFRNTIVARIRDLVRNDGWASGAVTRILDNVCGPNLRPIAKPDHRFLRIATGIKAFDHDWAKEFGEAADANWKSWANDMGRWCDATRNMNFAEMMRVAFRHKLIDGDALAQIIWAEDRMGFGRARYATAVQLIDPDRLSNPFLMFDQAAFRGGVHIDKYGAADGYYIRRAHQADWWSAADSFTWDLIPREYPWGRPIIVHDFDGDRANQHRGGAGIFTPVVQRLKMLIKYDGVELDSAIINSLFSAYIESPFDHQMIQQMIDDPMSTQINKYQQERGEWRKCNPDNRIMLGNSRITSLFPGEKIGTVSATRPSSNFKEFENAVLRNVATGVGLSAQQITNDWSDVNYSSARAALLESWKTLTRRRVDFTEHFCSPIRLAWMEESMSYDELPLPKGAPPYQEYKSAYAGCAWMGPPRGWVDPVAEKQGAVLGMQSALSTLEMECAEQGLDYREILEQRAHEVKLFKEYGIALPDWTGENLGITQGEGLGNLPPKPKKATGRPEQGETQER